LKLVDSDVCGPTQTQFKEKMTFFLTWTIDFLENINLKRIPNIFEIIRQLKIP
jgi:hypothetical protein